jgi:hypothetical protein
MMNALARTVKMVFAAVFLAARPSSPFAWKRSRHQRREAALSVEPNFLTSSRRPSAAAGCARLASLAVLAGQHRNHELA